MKCHDCHAKPGDLHDPGCDVERCPVCGGQALSCGCDWPEVGDRIPWSGEWPGVKECRELGWFVVVDPVTAKIGERCGPEHPHAHPDLNRLVIEAKWDARLKKYVKK